MLHVVGWDWRMLKNSWLISWYDKWPLLDAIAHDICHMSTHHAICEHLWAVVCGWFYSTVDSCWGPSTESTRKNTNVSCAMMIPFDKFLKLGTHCALPGWSFRVLTFRRIRSTPTQARTGLQSKHCKPIVIIITKTVNITDDKHSFDNRRPCFAINQHVAHYQIRTQGYEFLIIYFPPLTHLSS